MIMLVFSTISTFAVPALIGIVVDEMRKKNWDEINYLTIVMLCVVCVSALASGMRASTFNIMSESFDKNLKYDLFFYIINKDVSWFDDHNTGDILSRMSSDTAVVQSGFSTSISMFIRSSIFVIFSICIMTYISW
jgi:ABC-type bacteriocin/lantibiotic exporter with double-glycine peptidase domain